MRRSGTSRHPRPDGLALAVAALIAMSPAASLSGQIPVEGEVRQLVTFHFLPGMGPEAMKIYRERALPFYERDEAMLSLRAFREVESSVPLDLVLVRAFQGMAGMEASNEGLRALGASRGESIGAIHGAIGELSQSHHDQFVEMLPALTTGDPAAKRLVAFVWYQAAPGEGATFESLIEALLTRRERTLGVASTTGRSLLSDGWSHLRMLGFDSLADYQAYWASLAELPAYGRLERLVVRRRQVVLAPVSDLSVR